MGVALTIIAIVLSGAAGVAAERRWPASAVWWARRALVFSLYTLIPFVVFFNLARVEIDADLGGGLVIGWVAILTAAGIAWLVGERLLRLDRPATGALITGTLVPNSGYLGYPLVASLLGFDALGEAVVYDIAVPAPSLLLLGFATGAAFGTRAGEGFRERMIAFFTRNPPLYAAIAALLAPDSLAPDLLVDISRGVVVALLPIGFFAVGAVLAGEVEEIRGRADDPRAPDSATRDTPKARPVSSRLGSPLDPPVGAAILLRLLVAPGLLLLLSLPFIDLPGPYLLIAAMPCGINTLVVAHVYGLDVKLAAQAVAWTTAIAVTGALTAEAIWG
ncbi:MAG TPA: AEC family transporter [Solirubrobacterales bacterium]|nr:AEC family transporter [Solirubrobacterales bacterium]